MTLQTLAKHNAMKINLLLILFVFPVPFITRFNPYEGPFEIFRVLNVGGGAKKV